MADVSFDLEWVDPEGARGPELRATWARLTIRVAGEAVTRVFDARTRSVRESVYLPLYPIAEWVASNWWRLLYETPSSGDGTRNGYESRHSLATASEGFALPDLTFEPWGDTVRVTWAPKKLSRAPLEFLSGNTMFASREAVRDGLERLVEAVLGRLQDEAVDETLLSEEWRAVRGLDPDEEEFCRLAGALGLDPFQIEEKEAETLLLAAERVPEELREEFFSSANPSTLLQESAALAEALEALRGAHEGLEPLRELRRTFAAPRPPSEFPWKQGYLAAQALRAHLELDGCPLPSFGAIEQALGVEEKRLEREIVRVRNLVTVDGVVALDAEQRPGFALGATTQAARRFGFCRELYEYLTASNAAPLIVTRGSTHRQQRNRAFAAELLLPSQALRERIRAEVVNYQEVNTIAEEFGVSWAVVSHQLENHHIARIRAD